MGTVYTRGSKLWIGFMNSQGKQVCRSTGLAVGKERQAEALLAEIERLVATGQDYETPLGPCTVQGYGEAWIKMRQGNVRTVDDEATRLRRHVFPHLSPPLGKMNLEDVRPRHMRDLVLQLRREGNLSPRSIRNVWGVCVTMFGDAVVDELISANPCRLKKGILPPNEDKDPEWRATAVYSRDELRALVTDDRIVPDRRMVYALKGLTGMRHGEMAALRWQHYDPTTEPLGRLLVANTYRRRGTKSRVTRRVPVHPTLARLLDAWREFGWQDLYGRAPAADDLIVPTRNQSMRDPSTAQVQLLEDIDRLGLRRRRGHDLRRTFLSLAQIDGARREVLKLVTHGQKGDILDGYTTFPWATMCAEVAKLKLSIELPSQTTDDRAAATTNARPAPDGRAARHTTRRNELDVPSPDASIGELQVCETPDATLPFTTIVTTVDEMPPNSSMNSGASEATPTGFEPVSPA